MTEHFAMPPSVPSPTGEALCRLCADSGATCCTTDPDLTYLSFPLSRPEWRRLLPYAALATLAPPQDEANFAQEEAAARTTEAMRGALESLPQPVAAGGGKNPPPEGDAVAAPEPNHPDFVTSMRFLFPGQRELVASLFPSNGTHYALRTRSNGSCVFLGSSGCRLPRNVRPWYCLLFPAWVSDGSLTLFLSTDCLISQKAKGPAHGIELLNQRPARIRELHTLLCLDWGLTPPG